MKSPAPPDPWIGRRIGDRQRYRLEQRLGSGGMGDVFVAMDTLLGQQVALKLLKGRSIASPTLRKRFEREVAICAALKSDHIVAVSDYGVTTDGYPFYVMEYLRGQSLGQLLGKQQRLSVERAVNIITQVCEGLHLAHVGVTLWWNGASTSEHVKVVHRDLKPDNIFIVPTALGELAKILDFGIAKLRNDTEEQTNMTLGFIGTFRYAAPEQLKIAKNLDERADIYSLGMILYEMLSGTDPFGFGSLAPSVTGTSWAMAHKSQPPIPLRSLPGLSHLSPNLEAVVMRCLQKLPGERFGEVEQLNRALQAAMSGQSTLNNTVNYPSNPTKQATTLSTSLPLGYESQENSFALLTANANVNNSSIVTPSEPERSFTRRLLLLGIGGVVLVAFAAVYLYNQIPPSETQALAELKTLKTQAKYQECTIAAETFALDSTLYDDAQRLGFECQIEYAKQLAAANNFTAAIAAAKKVPQNSLAYSQAQELIQEWSEI